jgi:hypothetical protein
MNDQITNAVRRLTARAARRIGRWQRRLPGRLQASDTFPRQAGWTITRTRSGGRTYRDPRFSQLSATHMPGPAHEPAPLAAGSPRPPPAPGALLAPGTRPSPAPAGQMTP